MKEDKIFVPQYCPICDREYTEQNGRTRHHVFPHHWYKKEGPWGKVMPMIKVKLCHECHEDFNSLYPMVLNDPWIPSVCVQNLVKFCKVHHKNAYWIYPVLGDLNPMR